MLGETVETESELDLFDRKDVDGNADLWCQNVCATECPGNVDQDGGQWRRRRWQVDIPVPR